MDLILNHRKINYPIKDILSQVKKETQFPYLKDIVDKKDNILITCPFHKGGQENHPSCMVYTKTDDKDVVYGTYHCFSCKAKGQLYDLVNKCFNEENDFGKEWLIERFGDVLIENVEYLEEIDLTKKENQFMDYDNYIKNFVDIDKEPMIKYLANRGISGNVIECFNIGYDANLNAVVFPVWDKNNNLIFLTKRNISDKIFHIPPNVIKPVYLLNFIIKYKYEKVYVCESQINALTLWSWGFPAVALFGTGTEYQYDLLNKSGVRNFVLCFDGDDAGNKGTKRFIENRNFDCLMSMKKIPKGKDVNDLSQEEFLNLDEIFI